LRKLIILFLFLILPALAEPVSEPSNFIRNLNHEGQEALVFSAELNIDNGNPYTRDKGERGMFGKLVFGTDDLTPYLDKVDEIFAEAKRLILGPLTGYGKSELSFCTVGKGVELDLETGEWVKSKGGDAIRIIHNTEYMGGLRRRYILLTGTIWRGK
jgi:hypothetical protein